MLLPLYSNAAASALNHQGGIIPCVAANRKRRVCRHPILTSWQWLHRAFRSAIVCGFLIASACGSREA
jgi:hypothetical protein